MRRIAVNIAKLPELLRGLIAAIPREHKCLVARMSAMGQERTSRGIRPISAIPPKPDIRQRVRQGCLLMLQKNSQAAHQFRHRASDDAPRS